MSGLLLAVGFAVFLFFGYDWYQRARVNAPETARKALFITIATLLFFITLRVGIPAMLSVLVAVLFLIPGFMPLRRATAETASARSDRTLSLREAASILGVAEDAGEEQINAAWRERMRRNHPDQGGTDAIASLINRARDVMLERTRSRS